MGTHWVAGTQRVQMHVLVSCLPTFAGTGLARNHGFCDQRIFAQSILNPPPLPSLVSTSRR
jgi:hypothetical protein